MEDKKRSANFNIKEEHLLITLVNKCKNIIENKKSDTNANSQKNACWVQIEKEFNAVSGDTFRDSKVLKKKYDNIKKRTKKKFADEKCYQMGTGSGPPKKIEITELDTEIKEILGTRLDGRTSQFDGDAENTGNLASVANYEELESETLDHDYSLTNTDDSIISVEEEIIPDHAEKPQTDWSKYTPDKLKTPRAQVLIPKNTKTSDTPRFRKEQSITNKLEKWTKTKTSYEETREKCLNDEHILKIKQMKEKHGKELLEIEMRMEFQKEEHKVKMEIRELEKQKLTKSLKK